MTRFRLIAAAATLGVPLMACGTSAQTAVAPERDTGSRVSAHLRFLADDAREGRGVGTEGLEQAAAYIARAFQNTGLEPGGTDGYFQPFDLDPRSPALAHTQLGGERVKNVIGVLPGRGALASQVVLIGAHYDHLGLGTRGYIGFSRDTAGVNVVHNGADDNASGTTALLETARNLARRQSTERRTIVFIAFTAEELGTIGAMHYVEHPNLPLDSAIGMVNFDMVGRMRGDSVIVGGTGSAPELVPLLESINARYGLNLVKQDDPWGSSDHAVFYGKEMPVLHFYTNLHADYHTPTDDWEKINVDGIVDIVTLASDLVWAMATRPEQMTYVAVARPERTAGPRASLGTVPDMVTPGEGMRIQAVRAGTAADEAGLQAGDVILRIGDVEVKDIYGLQTALTTYKAGDTVTILFLREGERRETVATLK